VRGCCIFFLPTSLKKNDSMPRKDGKSAVKKLELKIYDNDGNEVVGKQGKTR